MKRMIKNFKKQFQDYSLIKKMNISLFSMVIIPIFLLGCVLMTWIYRSNTAELYGKNHENLEISMQELEEYFERVTDLPIECSNNDSLLRIGEGRAVDKDYLEVRAWLDTIYGRDKNYENICITLNNGKQFQVGKYVKEEKADILKKLSEGQTSLWTSGVKAKYLLPGEKNEQIALVTFYANINEYFSSGRAKSKGVVTVRLKERELCNMYIQRFQEQYKNLFLMAADGQVISSADKSGLNREWTQYMDFRKKAAEKYQGSYLSEGHVYIYHYSEQISCWLVEEIPFAAFFGNILSIMAMLFFALLLCLLFCIFFGRVQKQYIIRPVFQMVEAFRDVEKGAFITIPYSGRSDEIGILQKSFNTMTGRLDRLVNQVYRADSEKKEAELRALTEQINPHFLYNTLDSIHWKAIRNRDGEVAEQIMALADVYRYLLNEGKEFIRVGDEIKFLERYLYLMNMRFGGRVTWESFIGEEAGDVYIPKLIIQPLIENAIVHGIEPSALGGKVILEIQKQGENLNIVVKDTGIGFGKDVRFKKDEVESLDGSFALKNINNRLKIHYPGRYEYVIESSQKGGSMVLITLTLEGVDVDEADDY